MTGHDDFDRTLAAWFEADALTPAPIGALDRVLDATRRRRPRPAWLAGPGSDWVGEAPAAASSTAVRWLPRPGVRWSTVLVLLLVLTALVGGALLVGAHLVQPSPLPTGRLGHLAYGLDGSIYVADWDGEHSVRIATGPPILPSGDIPCASYVGEGPMWSPDGRHLAYRSGWGDGCPGTVYIADPAGHVVASFPGTGWLVSWSPDSTRVATWVELGQTIGIYGIDGVRETLLTVPPGCSEPGDFDPVWSPGGTSLVVSLCVVPIDGRTPERASVDDARVLHAAYSRDGARMAFIAWPDSGSLVIAQADGTQLRVLAGAENGSGLGDGPAYQSPVVSPTGDQVAFVWSPTVYDPTVDPSSNVYELRVVDVASGKETTLARASGTATIDPIRFSPEGDRILFSTTDANGVTSLWSVNVDNTDARLLVPGTGWADWQWQPAGP